MKGLALTARVLLPLPLFIAAPILMYYERNGWGWCLFVGCLGYVDLKFGGSAE